MQLFWKYLCKKNWIIVNKGLQAQAGMQVGAGQFMHVCSGHVLDVRSCNNKKKAHASIS